jgi:hypothetical protein
MIMLEIGLVLAVIFAVLVARWILKRGANEDGFTPVRPMVPPSVSLNQDLQDQLRTTAIRGNPDLAMKELRRQTGMSELDAQAVVHALLAGRIFPTTSAGPGIVAAGQASGRGKRRSDPAAPIDAELLTMLRDLVAQDPTHRAAAVMLLRQHTGMNERDAKRFVDAL